MSAAAPRYATPAGPRVAPAPARPGLRVVAPPARARAQGPFLVMCIGLIGVALIGVLLLNTAMAQGAYEKHDLEIRLGQATSTGQQLREEIAAAQAPEALAASARSLGMVPAPNTGYLLPDGTVQGRPTPAKAGRQ